MIEAYQQGWVTGLALLIMSVELLLVLWRQSQGTFAESPGLAHRLAGAALLLALHLSLPSPQPLLGLLLLSTAGLAHAWDSRSRQLKS